MANESTRSMVLNFWMRCAGKGGDYPDFDAALEEAIQHAKRMGDHPCFNYLLAMEILQTPDFRTIAKEAYDDVFGEKIQQVLPSWPETEENKLLKLDHAENLMKKFLNLFKYSSVSPPENFKVAIEKAKNYGKRRVNTNSEYPHALETMDTEDFLHIAEKVFNKYFPS